MSDTDQKLGGDGQRQEPVAEQQPTHAEQQPTNAAADAPGRTSAVGGDGVPASKASSPDPKQPAAGAEGGHPDAPAHGHPVPPADGSDELAGDLDELMSVAKQRDDYLALAQRTQADFENYRKRVAREAAAAQERGVAALAKELLPALDNLDRALEAAAEDDPLLDGVRLVRGELSAALARMGIESFSPAGEAFDPSVHEALATVPRGEGEDAPASGVVVEVYQPGYRLGDYVIRAARVVVTA
jgi:molecular chaperone GrpE